MLKKKLSLRSLAPTVRNESFLWTRHQMFKMLVRFESIRNTNPTVLIKWKEAAFT